MTTSFANLARGRIGAAWRAHPFGIVLFAATAALALAGGVELARGRSVLGRLRPSGAWLWGPAAGVLVGWGVKVLAGLLSGELPLK